MKYENCETYIVNYFRSAKQKDIPPAKIKYEVVDYGTGKTAVVKAENIRYILIWHNFFIFLFLSFFFM